MAKDSGYREAELRRVLVGNSSSDEVAKEPAVRKNLKKTTTSAKKRTKKSSQTKKVAKKRTTKKKSAAKPSAAKKKPAAKASLAKKKAGRKKADSGAAKGKKAADPKAPAKKTDESGEILRVGDESFRRGQRGVVDIPVGSLMNGERVWLRATVLRGKLPGPTLGVFAAIHGDEINGVEIIRRLLSMRVLSRLRGDLIAIPVVNSLGFLARSRYLPDRRDLNRLFPGSPAGSLGGRLAHTLVREVLKKCTHVIDLHTGAVNRANLPQVRVTKNCPIDLALAQAFGAPVVIESGVRQGSMRATLKKRKTPVLVYEGGEALRLRLPAVRFGVRGTLSVMRTLGMLPSETTAERTAHKRRVVTSSTTFWERVALGGILTPKAELGEAVREGELLGIVNDPFGGHAFEIRASADGIVIGRTNHALVDEGDAVFHLAATDNLDQAAKHIELNRAGLQAQHS